MSCPCGSPCRWRISGGADRAVSVIAKIVENVDVLVGNEEDLQKGLGIPGPEVAAKSKLRGIRNFCQRKPIRWCELSDCRKKPVSGS